MPRFNRNQRSSGSRPNRAWEGFGSTGYADVAAAARVIVAGFVPVAGDVTVLRVVGQLAVSSDQAGVFEDQIGAFGLMVVSDKAFAVGIGSIPDPVVDRDDDGWFVYQSFQSRGDNSVTSSLPRIYDFDSKAKRIVPAEGRTIAAVLTNSGIHGISFAVNFRILAQLRGTR